MSRCKRTYGLDVYPRRPGRGNGISNAIVLCRACYEKRPFAGLAGPAPETFGEATKAVALRLAGNRCQCKSSRPCHVGSRAHPRPQEAAAGKA